MEIRPIHNEEDYLAALQEIETLFDAEPDTPEGEKLEVLVTLVEAYENKAYKISLPDPIEAIEYHMERLGLSRKDLEPFIGNRARVSEILNRKRPLSLRMMRNLSKGLGISPEILIQDYPTSEEMSEEEGLGAFEAKAANVWLSGLRDIVSSFVKSSAGNEFSISDSEMLNFTFQRLDQDSVISKASNDCFLIEDEPLLVPNWPGQYTNNCESTQSNFAGNSQRILK